jgi:hypothetical protein
MGGRLPDRAATRQRSGGPWRISWPEAEWRARASGLSKNGFSQRHLPAWSCRTRALAARRDLEPLCQCSPPAPEAQSKPGHPSGRRLAQPGGAPGRAATPVPDRQSRPGQTSRPTSRPTRPRSSTRRRQSFGRPLGRVRPGPSRVGHSDRPVQRHPCRIATRSSSLSLRGSRVRVGCPASPSMRPRICRKTRHVKSLATSWRTKNRAGRMRRPPASNGRYCTLVRDQPWMARARTHRGRRLPRGNSLSGMQHWEHPAPQRVWSAS